MSTPGWHPDPSGSPQQRYWDGNRWTEHTAPLAGQGPPPSYPTTPLPMPPAPPPGKNNQWFKKKRFFIPGAVVAVLIIFMAIGLATGSSKTKNTAATTTPTPTTQAPTTTSAAPVAPPATTTPAAPTTTEAAPTTTAAPATTKAAPPAPSPTSDGSFKMPNEVGAVLQDAQDDLQRVSNDPIFVSHSHDLLGDRFQILDRDWKVCTQNVKPGTKAAWDEHIDFGVVKLEESCP